MQQLAELKGQINHYIFFENIVYHTIKGKSYVEVFKFSNDGRITSSSEGYETYEAALCWVTERVNKHVANGDLSDFRRLHLRSDSNVYYAYSRIGNFFVGKHGNMLVVLDATTHQIIHATDFNRENIGEYISVTPDGRLLCLLGCGELLFIDTQTWQITHQKKVSKPFSFGNMRISPSGKKLLLTSEKKSSWLWNIETTPTVIHQTDAQKEFLFKPFFVDDNTVCGYDTKAGQSSFYDISSGSFVPLNKHIPFRILHPLVHNNQLFTVAADASNISKNVIQVDLKDYSLVSNTALGEQFNDNSVTPVMYPNRDSFAFTLTKYSSATQLYKTTFFKFDMQDNTLNELKTLAGRPNLAAFENESTALILRDGKLEKLEF